MVKHEKFKNKILKSERFSCHKQRYSETKKLLRAFFEKKTANITQCSAVRQENKYVTMPEAVSVVSSAGKNLPSGSSAVPTHWFFFFDFGIYPTTMHRPTNSKPDIIIESTELSLKIVKKYNIVRN